METRVCQQVGLSLHRYLKERGGKNSKSVTCSFIFLLISQNNFYNRGAETRSVVGGNFYSADDHVAQTLFYLMI